MPFWKFNGGRAALLLMLAWQQFPDVTSSNSEGREPQTIHGRMRRSAHADGWPFFSTICGTRQSSLHVSPDQSDGTCNADTMEKEKECSSPSYSVSDLTADDFFGFSGPYEWMICHKTSISLCDCLYTCAETSACDSIDFHQFTCTINKSTESRKCLAGSSIYRKKGSVLMIAGISVGVVIVVVAVIVACCCYHRQTSKARQPQRLQGSYATGGQQPGTGYPLTGYGQQRPSAAPVNYQPGPQPAATYPTSYPPTQAAATYPPPSQNPAYPPTNMPPQQAAYPPTQSDVPPPSYEAVTSSSDSYQPSQTPTAPSLQSKD